MRKIVFMLVALLLVGNMSIAEVGFSKIASKNPELVQKGEKKHWCPVCGMSLRKNYKTSHTAKTKDGKILQYCSLRCLALDHQKKDINLSQTMVIDVKSEKLIPANEAYYVVGSKVPGTMSKISKLAFKNENDAKEFIKKMGGEIKSFTQAYKMAENSLQKDIAMLNMKKKKKMYPMGKKLYNAKCDKKSIDLSKFHRINELKATIKNVCKDLQEQQMQAVALYLWEVKRFRNENIPKQIVLSDKDKCPVCGMFVKKYPRWATKITYNHEDHEHYYAFDGVKDMVKFLHEPSKYGGKADFKIKNILVTDYYTQLAIDGNKAFYVMGSDVLGPMGHELVPFKSKSDAQTFLKDHKGKQILTLKEITSSILCKLDGQECD